MAYNVSHISADGIPRLVLSTLSEKRATERYDALANQLAAGELDGDIYLDQDGMALRRTSERYARNELPALVAGCPA